LVDKDLMNDAFDGENREHALGVWAAAKQHPWACFWAFTMCFTIVCSFLLCSASGARCRQLMPIRLWNRLTCS
jgi:hypothetical protein